ncbi:MAG TPA: DUF4398 domain-containing protein [Candidatus Methylomirabilis sp.]|nr:DUF4398 domain-containing protein [Candidatus Methylomirabilis sp.]
MKTFDGKWIVVLACVALFAGCGAANAISSARASFDRAKAAGAETKAPADYYMAEAYLEKADHEAKEGDNKQARYFADQSGKYSGQALQKAGGGAK